MPSVVSFFQSLYRRFPTHTSMLLFVDRCSVFNADLALSVTMTAISTILSILFLPANLFLYTRFSYPGDVVSSLNWTPIFIALVVVIVAIAGGLFTSYQNQANPNKRGFQHIANHMGNWAGFALILLTVFMSNSGSDSDSKIWSRDWTFYVGVALPCVGGLIIANVVSTILRLRKPERVTVAIECCYQNVSRVQSLCCLLPRDRGTPYVLLWRSLEDARGKVLGRVPVVPLRRATVSHHEISLGRYCYIIGPDDVSGSKSEHGHGSALLLRSCGGRGNRYLRVTCLEGWMDQSTS